MKNLVLAIAIVSVTATFTQADIIPATTADISYFDDLGDTPTTTLLGTPTSGNPFTIVARSRSNTGQNTIQISTFVDFDVSMLTTDVNDPTFSATLCIDYEGHLNNSQGSPNVLVGQAGPGTRDYDLGFNDGDQGGTLGIAATNTQTLVTDVTGTPGAITGLTADLTAIVTDWVNNPASNNGLVFFMDSNVAQAAYFDNAVLKTAVAVPEPSFLTLLGLGGLGMLVRRRK